MVIHHLKQRRGELRKKMEACSLGAEDGGGYLKKVWAVVGGKADGGGR